MGVEDCATHGAAVYVFGDPVSKSFSPDFHRAIFTSLKLPWHVSLLESSDVEDLRRAISEPGFVGAAVTILNKTSAMAVVERLTPDAVALKSINTVYVRDDQGRRVTVGTNTDWLGMSRAILGLDLGAEDRARAGGAVVLGTGVLCRTAIYGLTIGLGASRIYMMHDDASEVEDTLKDLQGVDLPDCHFIHLRSDDYALKFDARPTIVINANPSQRTPNSLKSAMLDRHGAKAPGILLDLASLPGTPTELARTLKDAGWKAATFVDFFAQQGIEQDSVWTGTSQQQHLERGLEAVSAYLV
ncbi:uncharacterized protein Z518_03586 [Rhinocladiella mackenziei CBS 650.93]|uniref:Shikimate dehydrogenase substrate binding N-terminal domain-containing protein n=1 Tax=Rhinocladiella mackenziei CBS 650.93 TaxID=1442369 RepID=A0A0D2IIP7_9EURO|nr:uncharacterized protein Z518_03586 [Rhinocladiella mackenziei CBS 650.93]KIX05614.1 hypothetical protein Z518_03586 [Rhinocladiella mackenziei CBS 650.93]